MNNYDEHINTTSWRYDYSIEKYNKICDNDMPNGQFLSMYCKLHISSVFPSPIILSVSNGGSNEHIDKFTSAIRSDKKLLDDKIDEYIKFTNVAKKTPRHVETVRKIFDYEIRDAVQDIIPETYATNAWVKLYEILSTYKLFNEKKVSTFHLCEHPGAFIYAMIEYAKRNDIDHDFMFQSLKPTDGKKIFKVNNDLIDKYPGTLDYGPNNGDLTDTDNIKYYISKYKNKYDMITSDCGLDCWKTDQEITMIPIFVGAYITAIGMCKKGGSYIFKMFSFHDKRTIELLILCTTHFGKVDIVRVMTTKVSSGEVYIVCRYFKGVKNIDDLIHRYSEDKPLVDHISSNTYSDLVKYNKLLTKYRIIGINFVMFRYNNIDYVANNKSILEYVKDSIKYYTNYYLRYCDLN